MPLKRAIIPLLDEVTATARAVEAVNTVLLVPAGQGQGAKPTSGLVNALAERGVTDAASAAVLHAGATGSSALSALPGIAKAEVEVYIRDHARDAKVHAIAEAVGTTVRVRGWAEAAAAFECNWSSAPRQSGDGRPRGGSPDGSGDAVRHAVPPVARRWPPPGRSAAVGYSAGWSCWYTRRCCQVELMTGRAPAPSGEMRAAGEAALAGR